MRRRRLIFLVGAALLCSPAIAAASPVRIAFEREAESHGRSFTTIWVADGHGGNQRDLGRGLQALISPNGRLVAAWGPETDGVTETDGIAIYSTDGGHPQRFFQGVMVEQLLAWSPDSRYLAVYVEPAQAPTAGLYVIDLANGQTTFIASGTQPAASFAPGRPDRMTYSISTPARLGWVSNVFTTSPEGTGTRQLTHDGLSTNPVWGSHWIAFARMHRTSESSSQEYQSQIWLMRQTGASARSLTRIRLAPSDPGMIPFWWSGNGHRLIGELQATDDAGNSYWTISAPSGRSTRIVFQDTYPVASGISRDGASVLLTYDRGDASFVGTIPFAGGSPTMLIKNALAIGWNG